MVRPIDLQDNLSKAPLAGREQQIQQSVADQGQRQGAQALNREHLLDQSRTLASAESDAADNRVDDHEERERRGGSGRRRAHGAPDGSDGERRQAAKARTGPVPCEPVAGRGRLSDIPGESSLRRELLRGFHRSGNASRGNRR